MNTRRLEDETEVAREAKRWVSRMRDDARATPEERDAFQDWLLGSPTRVRHYLAELAFDDTLQDVRRARRGTADDWIANLRAAVVAEEGARGFKALLMRARAAVRTAHGARFVYPAFALGIAVSALFAGFLWERFFATQEYRSTATELQIALRDGSRVTLRPDSHIVVSFSSTERGIELVSGDAQFSVHPDPGRPFRVRSESGMIEAVGTLFSVSHRNRNTRVTVLEGHVRVSGRVPSAIPSDLFAGQEVHITAAGIVQIPRSIGEALSNSRGSEPYQFRRSTLAEIACAFNARKRPPPLIVEGAARDRRISAALSLDDPASFLRVLEQDATLKLERRGDAVVIREVKDRTAASASSPSAVCFSPVERDG